LSNATQLWESCGKAIRAQVSDVVWQTTFSSARPISLEDDTLIVVVPSTVVKQRIEGRYNGLVHDAVSEAGDDRLNLLIRVETATRRRSRTPSTRSPFQIHPLTPSM
jgi:chromosomal replication initiation ATPase DnaA